MPGVINMDHGGQNGMRTNHDKDTKLNGANGAKSEVLQNGSDKGHAAVADDRNSDAVNGNHSSANEANASQQQAPPPEQHSIQSQTRMNDLPNDIVHITQGFIPLSLFLTRLAQTTHNSLQDKVIEMAKMAVPAAATNGNAAHPANGPDDASNENLRKKAAMLNFAQDMHSKWVKALVITEWSRKAEMVSKLIDLKFHIDQQRILYDAALDNMVNVKRDLTYARMPSPDLKTALQVLSTGTAPWIPDLQYIEPPSLTSTEKIKWINDLNTLLSLRLNLEDFDKIPYPFRNYEIDSGRVTFKVPGEFEVDLTIADEDFEKQFWFIDFRFAFQPAASLLSESLRGYLEAYVNDALSKDGLAGCYQFLHEFVLTHKLNELKRQAMQLSKSSWTGTLMVEPLHRALAIQYWTSRSSITGSKSWVLVAVHSNRKKNGEGDGKSSSCLTTRWYRDNKEVKDANIPLDVENLSAEDLLKAVVGRHIEFILSSIHDKLRQTPRFQNRQAGTALYISESDPATSSLSMHIGYNSSATLLVEPKTGLFATKPHSKFTIQYEHHLNSGKASAEDGVNCLESIRCNFMEDELNRRGSCMGWSTKRAPLSSEELRSAIKTRDWTRTIWLQRDGWGANWFVLVLLSLSGDEWWLLETSREGGANRTPSFQTKLPLNRGHPDLSDSFWNNLTLFATGMIAQSIDMRELHHQRIKSKPNDGRNWSLPQQVRLPSIDIALSGISPSMVNTGRRAARGSDGRGSAFIGDDQLVSMLRLTTTGATTSKQPWASDIIAIKFKGVESHVKGSQRSEASEAEQALVCVSDAVIKVRRPAKFASLKGTVVDRDVTYNPKRGEFCLRIRHDIGTPILASLKNQVKAVDRFVNFLESMERAKGTIRSERTTLSEVVFSYRDPVLRDAAENGAASPRQWRVSLDLSKDDISIKLAKDNPHLKVIDLMQKLVNSDGGIEALMAWLPISLPAMRVIEDIVAAWADAKARRLGEVELSLRTIDWVNIRYSVAGLGDSSLPTARNLTLDLRMKIRRGEPWWHVCRASSSAGGAMEDEFDAALKPIWNGKGDDWIGLSTSAAGRPSGGVVGMLTAIDEAIRAMTGASTDGGFTSDSTTTQNSSSQSLLSSTQPTTQHSQGSISKGFA